MNTRLMALDYIKRAKRCYMESKTAFDDKDYPVTIRRAQECVELSLKAVLRSIAIEYPREHEVSKAFEATKGKFPDWFVSQLPEFMDISIDLSKKRGPAWYGDEAELKPASEIFNEKDADTALVSAGEVFQACSRLISEIFPEKLPDSV